MNILPERIKLNVGGVSPSQLAVYEEFSRNIPGFLPITERDAAQFAPKMAVSGESEGEGERLGERD